MSNNVKFYKHPIGADYTLECNIALPIHLWEQAHVFDRIYQDIEQVVIENILREKIA